MLTISNPMKGGGKGEYYLNLAREDYYQNGGEPPGRWLGKGAEETGLSWTVEKDDFRNLLKGFDPSGNVPVVQNAGDEHRQSGWDLTFSAPKSVSALWSQADENIQGRILKAHDKAVEKACEYLEEKCGYTRRGAGGKEREKVQCFFAAFQHGTNRNQEPQIHTHSLLLNLGLRQDGSFGTITSNGFFAHKMRAGREYQEELAAELKADLGLKVEWQTTGSGRTFEIKGVPSDLCEFLSSRRKEIVEAMKEAGTSGPEAAKVATLKTRKKKEHAPREELFKRWQRVGEGYNFGRQAAQELCKERHELKPQVETQKAQERAERAQHKAEKQKLNSEIKRRIRKKKELAVVWKAALPFGRRIEIGEKRLFPNAPEWSGLKEIKTVGVSIKKEWKKKDDLKVYAKISLPLVKVEFGEKKLFPKAASWNPLKDMKTLGFTFRADAAPWKTFLSNLLDRRDLMVAPTPDKALEALKTKFAEPRIQLICELEKGPLLREKLREEIEEKFLTLEQARKQRPEIAVILLDEESFKRRPADYMRLAETPFFFTDAETLRTRFSQERLREQQEENRRVREELERLERERLERERMEVVERERRQAEERRSYRLRPTL